MTFDKKVKFIDLFAGIGGFHHAALKVFPDAECVMAVEWDKSCQKVYSAAFPDTDLRGDIREVLTITKDGQIQEASADEIRAHNLVPEHDILFAGFPCQPFSNSGLKLGLSDPRGQFYFRIEEIIKKYSAKSFILENVPGIKTNGGGSFPSKLAFQPQMIGQTMKYLEQNLMKLKDYHVRWMEIDSSQLGSPQVRKRVYIIGIHKDFVQEFEFQFGNYQPNTFMSVVEKIKIESLEFSDNQEANLRSFISQSTPPSYKDGMRRVGKAYLCAGGNVGQGYHAHGMVPTLTKVWARFLPIYFPHEKENLPEVETREFSPNRYYGKGYLRKASVREVMRLQGFPDSFQPHATDRIAYEHAGNAVNAKIIREIADNLLHYIKK